MQTFNKCAVFEGYHFNRKSSRLCAHSLHARVKRSLKARNLHGAQPCNMDEWPYRVGAVIKRAHRVAPMLRVGEGIEVPAALAVVHILALAVFEAAEHTVPVERSHLFRSGHIGVVFGIGIDFPRSFNRFDELHGLFHRLDGQNLAEDIFAGLQAFYRIRGVLVCVVCENNAVRIMLQKFVELGVIAYVAVGAVFPFGLLEPFFSEVADRRQLRVFGEFAVVHHGLAAPCSENSDFYLLRL